ncbi:hypothetical protein HDU81_009067 [Chytriomyces hyalinus]|nr:hypothetical protein HDU81_009067 [Chytriomyces hyalinus]
MPLRQLQQHRQHTVRTHTLLGCYQLEAGLPATQTDISECFSQCLSGFPLIGQSTQNIPTCICHTTIPTTALDAAHCSAPCLLRILPAGGCGGSLAVSAYNPALHKPIKPADNEQDTAAATAAATQSYKPAPYLSAPIIAFALCLTGLVGLGLFLLLSNNFYKNRRTQWRRRLNGSSEYPTRLQIDNPEHWPEFARTLRIIQEQAKSELPQMEDDYAGRPSYVGVEAAASAVAFYSQQYSVANQGQESRYQWQDDFDDIVEDGINNIETLSPNTSQGASTEKNLRCFNLGVMPHILKSALLETEQVRSLTAVEGCDLSSTERQYSQEQVDRKAATSSLYMDALEKNYQQH